MLLGAHLDSWDLGTGALDNGVNCALVVEVARAIAAGPRPRRTVRFVLFTGEEIGLLGSRGYVAAHRDEMDRHVAVLIHDIGDGQIIGLLHQRPARARRRRSRAVLAPVAGWGAAGLNDEAILGTDNFDFLLEGVPNLSPTRRPRGTCPTTTPSPTRSTRWTSRRRAERGRSRRWPSPVSPTRRRASVRGSRARRSSSVLEKSGSPTR